MKEYRKILQSLFTIYREENYIREEVFLPFRDSVIHNSPISLTSVFQLLLDADLIPYKVSHDKLIDIFHIVCCSRSENSTYFYKNRSLRMYPGLKQQTDKLKTHSKLTIEATKLKNDPGCFFFEFCLLILILSYTIAKEYAPKRTPNSLFQTMMNIVFGLTTDSKFEDKNYVPTKVVAKSIKSLYKDCFSESRTLKPDYQFLKNPVLTEKTLDRQSIVKSIRVKSVLSK